MKFYLSGVDAELNLKEFLIASGISVALFGGLVLFKYILMLI